MRTSVAEPGYARGVCDGSTELLQREAEVQLLEGWLDDAFSRDTGHVALVLAGAGLGKTTLLRGAAAAARVRSMRVLGARGSELEAEMGFGLARQLFEGALRTLPEPDRKAITGGAAALALPAVSDAPAQSPVDQLGAIHGLYWLAGNLAENQPTLLVVDDAHWGDDQTLRWLAYLAPRVAALPLLVLVAARPSEPGAERALLNHLAAHDDVAVMELAPLGPRALGALIESRLGRPGDDAFAVAVADATGGNPFYVGELLRAIAEEARAPTAANAGAVGVMSTAEVARSVTQRLERAGAGARAVAEAVAVLGGDAELRHVCALAGLPAEDALDAIAVLARAGILRDVRPVEFEHPVVRSAVESELGAGDSSRLHRKAADLLQDAGASIERIALHASATEPAGDPVVVTRLREAAAATHAAGAPDAAARYLRRALDEPAPADLRPELLVELGRSLMGVDYAAADESLAAAAGEGVASVRVEAQRWRGQALGFTGRMAEAVTALDDAAALAVDPEDALLLAATRDFYALGWFGDPDWRGRSAAIQARADELQGRTPGERRALSAAAFDTARTGDAPAARALELAGRVRAALTTWLDADPGVETPAGIGESSILADDPDALARHERAVAAATGLGMVLNAASALIQMSDIRLRRGALLQAEADARTAWQILDDASERAGMFRWWAVTGLIAVLTARGEHVEAVAVADRTGLWDQALGVVCTLPVAPITPVALAELDLARGHTDAGIDRLLRDGAWLEEHGWGNPSLNPWRARVAPALAMAGRVDEARQIAAEAVARARRFGAPWALGMALRAAGTVEPGADGQALLREAIAVLDGAGCRVEQAHAELELGAALRRGNARAEARPHLRRALDLASAAGAAPLVARANQELAASGARPRRERISGVDSLTGSERRVAELAAAGQSNPQIAQALFVTRKTVETHLRRVYMKLDIAGRHDLAEALKDQGDSLTP